MQEIENSMAMNNGLPLLFQILDNARQIIQRFNFLRNIMSHHLPP